MSTFTTLDRRVLDLQSLSSDNTAYLHRCYDAYRSGVDWVHFNNAYVNGPENPLLTQTHGMVTREVWNHPLYQAVRDLGDRLGISQGMLAPSGDGERDPMDDEWIPSAIAARDKGVSLPGLHKAITRGDVIARPSRPAGKRLLISTRSLECWQPSLVRQNARRVGDVNRPVGQ